MKSKRMIYFPRDWANQAGTKPNTPLIIYVSLGSSPGGRVLGSIRKEDLEARYKKLKQVAKRAKDPELPEISCNLVHPETTANKQE